MYGKFSQVVSTHGIFRGHVTNGFLSSLPEVGKSFHITDGSRWVSTSTVMEILLQDENVIEFKTRNSTYRLELK